MLHGHNDDNELRISRIGTYPTDERQSSPINIKPIRYQKQAPTV